MKRLQVRWTNSAYADLFEMLEYISADRPAAARKLGAELLKQPRPLAHHPSRGRVVPELSQQGITVYREILFSGYRLIYRLHPDTVRIVALIDARQNLGDVLLRRLLR